MERFTTEDLIQYLYNETSLDKSAAIEAAMQSDWNLLEKFEALESASKRLETISLSPRQQTIDFILNYAEKTVEELTPHA